MKTSLILATGAAALLAACGPRPNVAPVSPTADERKVAQADPPPAPENKPGPVVPPNPENKPGLVLPPPNVEHKADVVPPPAQVEPRREVVPPPPNVENKGPVVPPPVPDEKKTSARTSAPFTPRESAV